MKRILSVILIFVLFFSLTACGGSDNSSDPNLGTYTAVTAEAFGIELGVGEYFGEGFIITLKSGGKCTLKVDTKSASGKWTLDGEDFTVKGGGLECSGTLCEGTIILKNVEGSGITLTLVNPDYISPAPAATGATETVTAETAAAPEAPKPADAESSNTDSEKYQIVSYEAAGQVYGQEMLSQLGMEKTWLVFNSDGTCSFTMSGTTQDLTWADGEISLLGTPLYTYEYIDSNTVRLTMSDLTLVMQRID